MKQSIVDSVKVRDKSLKTTTRTRNMGTLSRNIIGLNPSAVRISAVGLAITGFAYALFVRKASAAGLGTRRWEEIPPQAIEEYRKIFDKNAKIHQNGKTFMNYDGFLAAVSAGAEQDPLLWEKQYKTLFSLADNDHDQLLTFEEFLHFEILMTGPEADYHIAFELFDSDKNGLITFDEFRNVIKSKKFSEHSFDVENNAWVKLFFGSDGKSSINYSEFTQLLKGLESELLMQVFKSLAKPGGQKAAVISGKDFERILLSAFSKRVVGELPSELRSNLPKLVGDHVTYPEFIAFYNVVMNFDRVKQGIILASEHKRHPQVTRHELLRVARRLNLFEFTPLETDVVFKIFDTDNDGLISLKDYDSLIKPLTLSESPKEKKSFPKLIKEAVIHFGLGSVAGAIGAAAVYPIDLVKTRMQNQRFTKESEKLYQNSWDCFVKVFKGEGPLALYRGLGPQLLGVAPEKAIKLTVNDLLRGAFGQPGGHIYLPLEILAGGCAGASQVIFTNPIEIVKIRLQVQGEAKKFGVEPKSTVTILRELGFRGLYKGAAACLLRDIPFSAIYFPVYAKCKEWLSDPKSGLPPSGLNLLLAGALAGIPAASLVTPADVIKTRLQVEARAGQQTYKNIPHCAATIYKVEGFRALWKGAGMRVFRSSPQFGVTLLSYEMLQRYFIPNLENPQPPTNAPVHTADYDRLFRGGVGRSLRRTEQRWGLFEESPENKQNQFS